jgi:hypothetical protein
MLPLMPKQGDRAPWLNTQNYKKDKKALRNEPVNDGVMRFTRVEAEKGADDASALIAGGS